MSETASEAVVFPQKSATRDVMRFALDFAVGAVGAVGTTNKDDPKLAVARSDVGTYTLTFPAGQKAWIRFMLLAADASPTAASFVLLALSPTAGTATFQATNGTAAAEIESGSTLYIVVEVAARKDG